MASGRVLEGSKFGRFWSLPSGVGLEPLSRPSDGTLGKDVLWHPSGRPCLCQGFPVCSREGILVVKGEMWGSPGTEVVMVLLGPLPLETLGNLGIWGIAQFWAYGEWWDSNHGK